MLRSIRASTRIRVLMLSSSAMDASPVAQQTGRHTPVTARPHRSLGLRRRGEQERTRNARWQPDSFDIPGAFDLLREVIGRTDALLYATERHFERFGWRCEGAAASDESERPLEHLSHLLGAARESAGSAVSLGVTIAAELGRAWHSEGGASA
jgi:hypothetical protein